MSHVVHIMHCASHTTPLSRCEIPVCHLQNARCLVKVRFSPKDSRIYEAKVPLFLGGNTTQPYYLVDVRGEGQYPRLKFDTKECILPPVPIGFISRAQFHVISQGYDNLQLKVWQRVTKLWPAAACILRCCSLLAVVLSTFARLLLIRLGSFMACSFCMPVSDWPYHGLVFCQQGCYVSSNLQVNMSTPG